MTDQPNRAEALATHVERIRQAGEEAARWWQAAMEKHVDEVVQSGVLEELGRAYQRVVDAVAQVQSDFCRATPEAAPVQGVKAEAVARAFHAAYEDLAPTFGYETRTDTREFSPDTPNGKLMIAVCARILAALETAEAQGWRTMDSAPRDGRVILAWWSPEYIETIRHSGEEWVWSNDFDTWPAGSAGPTHWMPLPAPPAAQEGR